MDRYINAFSLSHTIIHTHTHTPHVFNTTHSPGRSSSSSSQHPLPPSLRPSPSRLLQASLLVAPYNNAANSATTPPMAPLAPTILVAAPVKAGGVLVAVGPPGCVNVPFGLGPVGTPDGEAPEPPRAKLAHVSRVVFVACTTMLLSPKK